MCSLIEVRQTNTCTTDSYLVLLARADHTGAESEPEQACVAQTSRRSLLLFLVQVGVYTGSLRWSSKSDSGSGGSDVLGSGARLLSSPQLNGRCQDAERLKQGYALHPEALSLRSLQSLFVLKEIYVA
jgi:hypothetical protein